MWELVSGFEGRANVRHASPSNLSLHCGDRMKLVGEVGDWKSRARNTRDHTLLKTFSTIRIKCSFFNLGPWGSFFSGHISFLSAHSNLTNIEFILVPGMHQLLTSRSKAKEKSGPETLILYLLFTLLFHLAQSSSFAGFSPVPPWAPLSEFPCFRLCLLWGLCYCTPSVYYNYVAFPGLKLSTCTLFCIHFLWT